METTFREFSRNPPKVTHEPITRIVSKQLDIKIELDSVLIKIKNRKSSRV